VRFRVAIVSTPRSGNTWLRHLLMHLYDIPGLAVHSPAELDWALLPDRCVFQLHWPPTAAFRELLAKHDVRAVVVCRHPLDVLISVLHFTLHDASTNRWLEGEGGDERSILGAMPRSAPFQDYASGPRAQALLGISCRWWPIPGCCHLRYEELLLDTPGEVRRLVNDLQERPVRSPQEAAEETTISRLRWACQHQTHFWQGKADLWKKLLPAAEADALFERLEAFFAPLGYRCDPDGALTPGQADSNWIELAGVEAATSLRERRALEESLTSARDSLQAANQHLQAREIQIRQVHRDLGEALTQLHNTRAALAQARQDIDTLSAQLAPFLDFGPWSLGLARRAQGLTRRFPLVSSTAKRFLGSFRAHNSPEAPTLNPLNPGTKE
jgi:hypothetical protein